MCRRFVLAFDRFGLWAATIVHSGQDAVVMIIFMYAFFYFRPDLAPDAAAAAASAAAAAAAAAAD